MVGSRGANATSSATTDLSYDPVTGQPVVISGRDASWSLGGTLNFLPARRESTKMKPSRWEPGL